MSQHKLDKHFGGWVPPRPDHRDRWFNAEERILSESQVPPKHDLWPNVPSIWDQGQLGSCTAFGSLRAYLIEAQRQKIESDALSWLMEYYDSRALEGTTDYDAGASVRDAVKALAKTGCAPESDWPYDIAKFADKPPASAYADAKLHMALEYKRVAMSGPGAPMRTAISAGYGIVFGFPVPEYFEDGSWNPATDVLRLPKSGDGWIGGHCVVVTGYDFTHVPYFICDNSWGEDWGGTWGGEGCKGGRFAMAHRWFGPLADDAWIIKQSE